MDWIMKTKDAANFDPSRMYLTGKVFLEKEDGEASSDGESTERSSLKGAAIRARSTSVMKSSMSCSDDSSSMMYSEEEDGDSSSIASTNTNSSRSSTVRFYNPQTIHAGSFLHILDNVGGSSSSCNSEDDNEAFSIAHSDESSIFHADHYFNDPDKLVFPFQRQASSKKYFHIFTDDDASTSSSGCVPVQKIVTRNTRDVKYDINIGGGGGFADRKDDLSDISPATWENVNKERGRIVAHQLLQPFRRNSENGDTASISDDDCCDSQLYCEMRRSSNGRRPSLLGRVFRKNSKKRFTQSTSPLDALYIDSNKHRVSDLAVQALTDTNNNKRLYSSAVLTRNALVDFGAWEAVLAKSNSHTNFSNRRHKSSSACCSVIHEDEDNCTAIQGLEGTSHSSSEDDDASVLFIKTVSLTVQDFIFGKQQKSNKIPQVPKTTLPDLRDGLDECRSTSEDVAAALNITEEGRVLLAHVRGRAGIIVDLEGDNEETTTTMGGGGTALVPWIHILDQIWMPHYEEYVVWAVHAFARRLAMTQPLSRE